MNRTQINTKGGAITLSSIKGDNVTVQLKRGNGNEIHTQLKPSNSINVSIIGSGAKGKDGLDAYNMWLEMGNTGSLDDFFNSLKGTDGNNYIHPDKHSVDIIAETTEKQFISADEKLKISGFIHDQIASSMEWDIHHSLEKYPSVSVVDSGGNLVMGNVKYINKSNLVISFTSEFSGKAYLN